MLSALRTIRIRPTARISASLLAVLFLLMPPARAQSSDSAGLEIYVHDASGAVLADAKVHIVQQQQNIMRDGMTDKNGHIRFTAIPVGDYVVTVNKEGFSEMVESGISLDVSQMSTINLAMKIASSNTEVNVTAETPIIDTDRTSIGQTISTEEIEDLPSDNRNFLDFALLVPGISANASSGQGSGISANGGRQRSNSILVDGVENNGLLNGTVRQSISIDAVKAFDVITNQMLPEYGQASGAVINVITKSGSGQTHGSVYYYVRNAVLNAQGYCFDLAHIDCTGKNTARNDFGATLGGPLYKDKTFYFASGEYLGQSLTQFNTIEALIPTPTNPIPTAPLTVANVNSALANGFVVGTGVNSISANPVYSSNPLTLGSLRLDHTMNEKNTFIFRLLYAHYNNANPTIDADDQSLSDYSNYGKDVLQAYSMMGEWTHIFSPSLLNEAHFQFAPQYLTQYPNSTGVTTHIAGGTEFGPNPLYPSVLNETHYEWIDALSWTHGSHFVKVGADISYVKAQTTLPDEVNGFWHFAALGSAEKWLGVGSCSAAPTASTFGCGFPDEFHQAFGNPAINFSDKLLAFYIEDQWKVKPRLSLNYGIRYDLDLQPQGFNQNLSDPIQAPLPKGIPRDYNNISPRIGFALSLTKSGNTVLRGGYGMFYDRLFLLLARDALLSRVTLDDFTPKDTGAQMEAMFAAGPYQHTYNFPTTLVIPSVPSITSIAPKLPMPVAHELTLFLDQALTQDWELEVGGIFVSGQKLIRANNTNLLPPVILTTLNQAALGFGPFGPPASGFQPPAQDYGRPFYQGARLNPTFNNITTYTSSGHATYSALRASLVHRTTRHLTLRAGYVWSKTIDDSDDFTAGSEPTNAYVPQQEKGLSLQDQRNSFAGSAIYHMPYLMHASHNSPVRLVFGSWTATTIVLVHGGIPENPVTDSDSNGDGEDNDRPYTNLATCSPTVCAANANAGGIIAGRNTYRGPRSQSVQFRMEKDYILQNDSKFTFSVEAFNLFNHVNFTSADMDWGSNLAPSGGYGTFNGASTPRSIQLGLKYQF